MPENRDERKKAIQAKLQTALELEWATIPPYLTAYYSLRPEKNREVASLIRSVFMEEMLHLVLAANVLSAIDGKARLNGETCPRYPLALKFEGKRFADRRFQIDLRPFSAAAVETFLKIELPESFFKEPPSAAELEVEGSTIGEFYSGLIKDLETLCKDEGEAFVFDGKDGRQVPPHAYWSAGGGIIQVKDLKTALAALRIIIDQGEGADGAITVPQTGYFRDPKGVAHYFRFNEIKHGRRYLPNDLPTAAPSGPPLSVDYNAIYPIKVNCQAADFEGDDKLVRLSDRFNRTYSLMLRQLEEAFNGQPEVLFSATMDGMHGLGDIAVAMMQLPLPGDPHHHAAPLFQWAEP